jgi:hypothetical protein
MDMKARDWSNTALSPVGLIIRQKDPNNLEMPFDQLGEFITPSELFYIRSHFPIPELDPVAFRLSIRGAVRNELGLSYAVLRAMPSRKCVATLRRQQPGIPGCARAWLAMGTRRGRQCAMDPRSPAKGSRSQFWQLCDRSPATNRGLCRCALELVGTRDIASSLCQPGKRAHSSLTVMRPAEPRAPRDP